MSYLFRKKSTSQIIEESQQNSLHKTLKLRDLTALGIAAIIGGGIFSTIGEASADGGPAISLLFVFVGIAALFSAMCYAEFASTLPISGSAYTYAYNTFGELIAWIIGWDLIIEYAIGNIAVAISWSDYFTGLLHGLNVAIPEYFTVDYLSASNGFAEASAMLANGIPLAELGDSLTEKYMAWMNAPQIGGLRLIFDLPALIIVVLITWLVYVGIKESKRTANLFVLLKVIVILLVIAVGAFYVDPENWSPFAPHGVGGVLKGVGAVFFAYIGFDALSTTAEEAENAERDMPRSMIITLVICTILYIAVALVLTGMVSFEQLAVGDPLAFVFEKVGQDWMAGLVAASAVIAMASVLLVFQIGQPRIWMSMSRDGLLPKKFSKIHPKYKTPAFATIVTGFVVAVPALFMNLNEVADLTSIGTLFAFVVVCGGVLKLETDAKTSTSRFKVPFISSKVILPVMTIIGMYLAIANTDYFNTFEWSWANLPMMIFFLTVLVMNGLALKFNFSLIPVLGLITNLYLMAQLEVTNWLRFGIWLVIGLVIYFFYSRHKSNLNTANE